MKSTAGKRKRSVVEKCLGGGAALALEEIPLESCLVVCCSSKRGILEKLPSSEATVKISSLKNCLLADTAVIFSKKFA